jgi:hypothetical protein
MILVKKIIQAMFYAFKLEVEFLVLNKLVKFGQQQQDQTAELSYHGDLDRGVSISFHLRGRRLILV